MGEPCPRASLRVGVEGTPFNPGRTSSGTARRPAERRRIATPTDRDSRRARLALMPVSRWNAAGEIQLQALFGRLLDDGAHLPWRVEMLPEQCGAELGRYRCGRRKIEWTAGAGTIVAGAVIGRRGHERGTSPDEWEERRSSARRCAGERLLPGGLGRCGRGVTVTVDGERIGEQRSRGAKAKCLERS